MTWALIALLANFSSAQILLKDFNLDYGAHEVGLKHYTLTDSTRTYVRHLDYTDRWQHRPIPVTVWYPADGNPDIEPNKKSTPFTVKEYFGILAEEEEWENLPDQYLLNWFSYLPNNKKNQTHLLLETNAVVGLPVAEGTFPVLIYAPSYQAASIENFALCEYLASHGYIVVSSPSRGAYDRRFQGGTAMDIETQADDISYLIQHAYSLKGADMFNVATFGFSFGGISNVLAQMKDRRIKATASLDGSIKYQFQTLEQSPFYLMERMNVPFLHIAQKEIPKKVLEEDEIDPELNTEFRFWDKLDNADAYRLQMHDMTHSNFSSFAILFENRDLRQDKSDAEILNSYRLSAEVLKTFFDTYLKSDDNGSRKSMESFKAVELISYQEKKAPASSLTVEDFMKEAKTSKYEGLKKLYEAYRKKQKVFEVPEGILNHQGLKLSFNPETAKQAYSVFNFALSIYPRSSNLEDSWAEAYLLNGEKKKAIVHFKKSLSLNPENRNALDRLEQLESEK